MAAPITVLCLGLSNSGKSTFINEVLSSLSHSPDGRPTRVLIREAMTAMTTDVQPVQLEVSYRPLPHPRCRRVVLVDTPGFDHTDLSDADVFLKIATWVESHCPSQGIDAILYFHNLSCDWVSPTVRLDITVLAKLCGLPAANIITIITTKWDLVPKADRQARLGKLESGLWRPLLYEGSKVEHLHERGTYSAVFKEVLKRVGQSPVKIRLQQELLDENRPLRKTEAGRRIPGIGDAEKRGNANQRRKKGKSKQKGTSGSFTLSSLRTSCGIQ